MARGYVRSMSSGGKRVLAGAAAAGAAAAGASYAGKSANNKGSAGASVGFNPGGAGGYRRGNVRGTKVRRRKSRKAKVMSKKLRKAVKQIAKNVTLNKRDLYMRLYDVYPFCLRTTAAYPQVFPPGALASDRVGWAQFDLYNPGKDVNNQLSTGIVNNIANLITKFFTSTGGAALWDVGVNAGAGYTLTPATFGSRDWLVRRGFIFDLNATIFLKNNTSGGVRVDMYLVRTTIPSPGNPPLEELNAMYNTTRATEANFTTAAGVAPYNIQNDFQQFWSVELPVGQKKLAGERHWEMVSHATFVLNPGDEIKDSFHHKWRLQQKAEAITEVTKGYPMLVFRVEGDITHDGTNTNRVGYSSAQVDGFFHQKLDIYEATSSRWMSSNRVGDYVSQTISGRNAGDADVHAIAV